MQLGRLPVIALAGLTALAVPAAVVVTSTLSAHGGSYRAPDGATATLGADVVHSPTVTALRPHATAPRRRAAPPVRRTRPVLPRPADRSRTTTPVLRHRAAGGDDYPYRTSSSWANDPWGFTERQCVSFAAWRLAQQGHPLSNARQGWGSALSWDDTARRLGYATSTRPRVGAVAQWNAGESSPMYGGGSGTPTGSFAAGGSGHVGWVKAVYADGSALVEQYNLFGNRSYSVMRVKAPRYLLL